MRGAAEKLAPLLRLSFGLALLSLVALSCRADVKIDVDVEPDGSGTVNAEIALDAEAADQLLDLDRETGDGIPIRDLAEAGWEVEPPTRDEAGTLTIRASKVFGTTSQFTEVMDELSGGGGTFQDFTLSRLQSFGRLDYRLSGVIDTSDGFRTFADPELETALTRSLQSIAERYDAAEQNVAIEMSVNLPGELREDQSNGLTEIGETAVSSQWETTLATHGRTDVTLATTQRSTTAQVLRGVAVVAAVLAGLLIFARLLRLLSSLRRPAPPIRPRQTDAQGRRSDDQSVVLGNGPERSAADQEPSDGTDGSDRPYRVVALDGMGVLYREGNDIAELLVPFARQRGSEVPTADIAAKARLMSLGRLTSADFWPAIGVEGDPHDLDAAYLSMHQLSPGVVKYLRKLRSDGVRAACVTNDAAEWATKLRASHSLEGLIDPWVVSGSVGIRKPETPIFEVLRRVTGERPAAILIVDDDLETLDAARSLGFATAWFTTDGDRSAARGHDVWRRFELEDEEVTVEAAAAVTGEIQPLEPPSV